MTVSLSNKATATLHEDGKLEIENQDGLVILAKSEAYTLTNVLIQQRWREVFHE